MSFKHAKVCNICKSVMNQAPNFNFWKLNIHGKGLLHKCIKSSGDAAHISKAVVE